MSYGCAPQKQTPWGLKGWEPPTAPIRNSWLSPQLKATQGLSPCSGSDVSFRRVQGEENPRGVRLKKPCRVVLGILPELSYFRCCIDLDVRRLLSCLSSMQLLSLHNVSNLNGSDFQGATNFSNRGPRASFCGKWIVSPPYFPKLDMFTESRMSTSAFATCPQNFVRSRERYFLGDPGWSVFCNGKK